MLGRSFFPASSRGMSTVSEPLPPSDLADEGRALWLAITAQYEFRPDEAALVGEFCRAVDRLAAIREALADAPLVVPGSTKQPSAHPLLAAERAGQQVLVTLARQIGLTDPDDDQALSTPAKRKAATAANVRWMRSAPDAPTA